MEQKPAKVGSTETKNWMKHQKSKKEMIGTNTTIFSKETIMLCKKM